MGFILQISLAFSATQSIVCTLQLNIKKKWQKRCLGCAEIVVFFFQYEEERCFMKCYEW